MALEALVGGKRFRPLLDLMPAFRFLAPNIDSSASDVSDRYNNLKTAWESLVEAANHGHPHAFLLTVKIRQPSHEFTFGVGMSFIPYPLVLTPVV
jgi:hypothetical protein